MASSSGRKRQQKELSTSESAEEIKPPKLPAKRRSKGKKTFDRRIEFFRAFEEGVKPPKFYKATELRKALSNVNFDDESAYLKNPQENVRLAVWDFTDPQTKTYPIKWRLGLTTVDLVNPVEKAGNIRTPVTDDDEGGHHSAHIVFFEHGIVGIEYVHAGPRHGKLVEYINKMLNCPNIELFRCMTPQGAELLEQYRIIRRFEIKIRRTRLPQLKKDLPTLHSQLEAIRSQCDADEITLVMSADVDTKSDFNNKTIGILARLSKSKVAKQLGKCIKYAGTKKGASRMSEASFKKTHMFDYVRLAYIDLDKKLVDSESVFSAIIDAYNQAKERLEASDSGSKKDLDDDEE